VECLILEYYKKHKKESKNLTKTEVYAQPQALKGNLVSMLLLADCDIKEDYNHSDVNFLKSNYKNPGRIKI
jgi:hypothetical protein